MPEFATWSFHLGFVVDKVELRLVFLRIPRFPLPVLRSSPSSYIIWGWRIGPLVDAVRRHRLNPSTRTTRSYLVTNIATMYFSWPRRNLLGVWVNVTSHTFLFIQLYRHIMSILCIKRLPSKHILMCTDSFMHYIYIYENRLWPPIKRRRNRHNLSGEKVIFICTVLWKLHTSPWLQYLTYKGISTNCVYLFMI
jgi:hypothetical protein